MGIQISDNEDGMASIFAATGPGKSPHAVLDSLASSIGFTQPLKGKAADGKNKAQEICYDVGCKMENTKLRRSSKGGLSWPARTSERWACSCTGRVG